MGRTFMPKVYGFAAYGGPEQQDFRDEPKPEPGPADLLIAVHAAAVNPIDWKFRQGYMKDFVPLDLPAVLGQEAAGVVEAVGQDVEGFSVGDHVFGSVAPNSGGYAEYTLLTAELSAKKPPQVSFTDAAALTVAGGTALDAVRQLELKEGQVLLIVGVGGGIGVIAAQLARDAGIAVVGTGSEGKRSLAESLDVIFVDYQKDVGEQVRAVMPDGVDAVLDLIGGDAAKEAAGLLKAGGRLVTTADPVTAGQLGGSPVERDPGGRGLTELAALVAEGKLDPHAIDVLPFDQAAEALAGVETGHSRGKVVLTMR